MSCSALHFILYTKIASSNFRVDGWSETYSRCSYRMHTLWYQVPIPTFVYLISVWTLNVEMDAHNMASESDYFKCDLPSQGREQERHQAVVSFFFFPYHFSFNFLLSLSGFALSSESGICLTGSQFIYSSHTACQPGKRGKTVQAMVGILFFFL